MKFGKQLELGMYLPWQASYLGYKQLKRIITRRAYLLKIASSGKDTITYSKKDKKESKTNIGDTNDYGTSGLVLTEYSPLLSTQSNKLLSDSPALEDGDVEDFFVVVESELAKVNKFVIGKLAELRLSLASMTDESNSANRSHHTDGDRSLMLRTKNTYIQLIALRKFCSLNSTGFVKIVKKYDKQFGTDFLLTEWNKRIEQEFITVTCEPQLLIDQMTLLVSRDHLVEWEQTELDQYSDRMDEKNIFKSVKPRGLLISVGLVFVSQWLPLSPADACAQRCLSLLIFVISLWVTQTIPYFSTALLVPVLVTSMSVLRQEVVQPDGVTEMVVLNPKESADFAMNHMFNHTSVLILGGYTISSAFSRCQLELHIASYLQRWLGDSPKLFLLSVMMLGLFLAMWISNHTAPILCVGIIFPIITDLPRDSRYSKALLLGLAFACNFGGLLTPISSLQNVIAVAQLQQIGININFAQWMLVSVPFGVVGTLLSWFVIVFITHKDENIQRIPIVVIDLENKLFTTKNVIIISTSLLVCILFAMFGLVSEYLGDIGVVSLVYMCFMFGSGILSEVDFLSLRWQSIMLLGGGSVLGKAVETSGLLQLITDAVVGVLPMDSPRIAVLMVISFVCLVSTFVSHTVAALILIPMVLKLGVIMNLPAVLVICSAFAVSAGMALPFSSFPNVNSLLVTDDFKKSYLSTKDFLLTGTTMSVLAVILLVTFVYTLIELFIA